MARKKKNTAVHETTPTGEDAPPPPVIPIPEETPNTEPHAETPDEPVGGSVDGDISVEETQAEETETGESAQAITIPDAVESDSGEEPGEETADTPDNSDDDNTDEEDEDPSGDENGAALPLPAVVEALLFAAREPLKPAQIARAVGKRTRQEAVKEAIDGLNVHYLETGRAFEIAEISGRYQLMSRPEFAPHIMKIYPKRDLAGEKEKSQKLTPAALDTLAIIAYKQPVTRAEIEHVRGVGCGPVLKALLERDSIRIAGKRLDMLGQPLVYGTTESFLAEFGLGSLDELPMRNDFLAILGEEPPPPEALAPIGEEDKPAGDKEEDGLETASPENESDATAAESGADAAEETDPESTISRE